MATATVSVVPTLEIGKALVTSRDFFGKRADGLGVHGVRVDADARQSELNAEGAEHGVLRGGTHVDEHLSEAAARLLLLLDRRLQLLLGYEIALSKDRPERRARMRRLLRGTFGRDEDRRSRAPQGRGRIESQGHEEPVSAGAIGLPRAHPHRKLMRINSLRERRFSDDVRRAFTCADPMQPRPQEV